MNKKRVWIFFLLTLFLFRCSTQIEEGSLLPTAPSAGYTVGTNKPSAPGPGAGYTGSFGNLKATVEWTDPDSTVASYEVYRNGSLIAAIDKKTENPVFGLGGYIYTDTVPAQGAYAYKVLSVGLNGKTNGLVQTVACTNYTNSGNLSGRYYTILNAGGRLEKRFIGGAEVLIQDLGGDKKTAYMRTDGDGRFSFEKLPYHPLGYSVTFQHPVYAHSFTVMISNGFNIITNVHP